LRQVSGEVLQVSEGSLYPALHKLEHQGWIRAEWKLTDGKRRAKFYALTHTGRKVLLKESAQWDRLSAAVSHVLRTKEA
jgi:DNA-binding PadR family transcriptional regulator